MGVKLLAGTFLAVLLAGACVLVGGEPPPRDDPGALVSSGDLDGVDWRLFAERRDDGEVCLTTSVLGMRGGGCQIPDGRVLQGFGAGGTGGGPTVAHGLVSPDVTRVHVEARLPDGQRVAREAEAMPLLHIGVQARAWGVGFPEGAQVVAVEALDATGGVLARQELESLP